MRDQPAVSDVSPTPIPDDNHNSSDSPDGPDPTVSRLSNISSDFDSADKCSETSGQNHDSEGEGEVPSSQPHLMVVHVTPEGVQEKDAVDNVYYRASTTRGDSSIVEDDVTSQVSGVTCVTEAVDDVMSLKRTDELCVSPRSTAVSDDTLSAENSLCMDSVSLSTSTLMEGDIDSDDVTFSPDRSYQTEYLPNIYSDTPLNISDATFSDASLEKSRLSQSRLADSNLSLLSSLPRRASSGILSDSDGTPPVSLDSEGAEELGDTASWPRSPSTRTMSDLEIVHPEDVPPLEGSFLSTASGSSLPRSPGSTEIGLRLLADSWADYSPPGQGYVQFFAVSDIHIWCVTTYDLIFYCPTHFSVVTWTQLRGSARMIAANNAGDVIWCIDRKNYAHARFGISANHLTGKKWQPVEKDMRYVSVDQSAVWGIKVSQGCRR